MLEAQLPRSLKVLGVEASSVELSHVVSSFAELELQPGALESFRLLSKAGWQLVALTNGSEDSTRLLLEQVSALQHFTNIFSCDAIQKTKPHPDVYALPKQDAEGDVWMVAVHAWDIAGAAKPGLRTAFITSEEKDYLSIYPQPELVTSNLVEAASKIVQASDVTVV